MAERVSFKVEGRGSRYGQLHMEDGQLSVTLDNGEKEVIAWENFRELNFYPKHDSIRSEEPDRERALSKTWRHADVGPMVAKGSAHGDESGMDLFTSRRVSEEGFRAFSMAYQE